MAGKGLVLVTVVAFFLAFLYSWGPPLTSFAPKHSGIVIVNSPTIYTRQRLVNDRLSQTAWLKDQLEVTKDPSGPFRSIDVISNGARQSGSTLSIGRVSSTDNASKPDEPAKRDDGRSPLSNDQTAKSSSSGVGVDPTTADLFRAKNAYREEVRSEMMEAQLDDRHDIEGNTIHRLAFGATVVPGTRLDELAIIKVTLSHDIDPKREPKIASEYNKLYEDWLRSMQMTLDKSVDPIVDKIYFRQLDSRLTTSLPRFVLKRVCELLLSSSTHFRRSDCVPINGAKDDPDSAIAQASKAINRFTREYLAFRRSIQLSAGVANIRRAVEDAKENPSSFSFLENSLERWCDPQLLATLPPTRTTGSPEYLPAIKGQSAEVRDIISNRKIVFECPAFDLPAEKIGAGLFLYYKLFARPETTERNPLSLDDVVNTIISEFKSGCSIAIAANCTLPSLTRAELRCVAADYMREYLNFFGDAPRALKREPLARYLNMELLGPETGSCSVSLSEASYRASGDKSGVDRLRENLNRGIELYSYAIAPKNLVQHISTALETRDTIQALANAQAPDLTSALEMLKQRSSYNRAIEANPVVLGFGASKTVSQIRTPLLGHEFDDGAHATEFGWIIAPQMRVGSEDREQVNGQYGLSAVVSLPAWWPAARLLVKTCWISRSSLHLYRNRELCTDDKDSKTESATVFSEIVRLPVSIAEISHKLAFEVVQEPHLILTTTPDTPFEVTVGQPAELLIRGSRLWRSTEVTLGSQRADEIVVLPDMEGLIARFKCVKMQKAVVGSSVKVKVFTSEGEADPEYAHLNESSEAKPCPEILRDLGGPAVVQQGAK